MNTKDLVAYAKQNRKFISIVEEGQLVKLNYTNACQYENIWNPFTMICRGIIINIETNQIIAHPFDKFFNEHEYLQQGVSIPVGYQYWITEKLDGVLIIPYYYDGKLCLSSRGSFHNEYIDKAYQIKTFNDLPLDDYTFMFELISPEYATGGFLVTKYKREALVLVGARENATDRLLSPPEVIMLANQYHLDAYRIIGCSYEELKALQNQKLGETDEGWVVFFNYQNGFLVKIKRLEYLNLFRAMKNVNQKTILTMLLQKQFETFKQSLPEELILMADEIYNIIEEGFQKKYTEIQQIFEKIPTNIKEDQKAYSLYIIERYYTSLLKYLYKYKSTQNIEDLRLLFYRELLGDMK